jgi:RES domain-containing protein
VAVGVGFRISDWDTPLRPNPHRSPGRYHRAGSPPTQYIALHPLGPWGEYLRYHDLRRPEDIAELRLNMWALRVDLGEAVEIGFENALADFGLQADDLVDDDYTACQALADRLRADSATPKAIVVPSAALPGAKNLVILGARVAIPYLWAPIDSGDIPACALTKASRPPTGLVDRVRFAGESHAELEAWKRGQRYELTDLE